MALTPEAQARIAKNNEEIERQGWESKPADLYADVLELWEDDGVVRLTFRCSRPDINDPLGGITVVVSRISMPWHRFNSAVKPFQDKMVAFEVATKSD